LRRSQIQPEPEEIEDEMEYEVEWILKSKIQTTCQKISRRYRTFQSIYFLVKWQDYPDNKST
jgi:hypothetical protein